MVLPFPLRAYHSDLRGVSGARHPAYNEVVERGYRVGLGPQADLAGAIAGVLVIQEECAIEIRLDVLTHGYYPDRMPLPKCRWLYASRRQLVSPAVVVIQPKIVLQGIGPHDIVMPLCEAKDDAARGIFPACHGLELDRDIDVRVGCGRCHNDVEGVLHGALDQDPLATGCARHLFDTP